MKSSWGIAVVAAAVLVSVVGCAGSDPSAEPAPTVTVTASASSTPSASPAPVDELASVDTIVVTAAGLSLRQGDSELAMLDVVALPLDEAVALLSRALGEPEEAGVEEGHCTTAQTRWLWGESTYLGTPDLYTDEGTLTFVTLDTSVSTSDGREVRLETTGGLAVGDPVAPLVEATDPALVDDFSGEPDRNLNLVYDLVRIDQLSDEQSPYGASVGSVDGVVTAIRGQSMLKDYC
jgi:hypothetical protein